MKDDPERVGGGVGMLGAVTRARRIYDSKYEALEEVGRGSFGVVWRGRDIHLQRDVAIKILDARGSSASQRDRFQREARILAALDHPNIVPVYSFGEQGSELFFVMKFVEGDDLSWVRHARERTTAELAPLLSPIAEALDYAHSQSVIHRDLKPANIRITPDGKPVLIDFGIAQAGGFSRITRPGSTLGSPHYMAPEQTSGRQASARSDQYTLALIVYELIAGRRPFEDRSTMEVLYDQVNTPPPPLRLHRPAVPSALEEGVLKALSKDEEDRFDSCVDFLRAAGLYQEVGGDTAESLPSVAGDASAEEEEAAPLRLVVVEDELADYLIAERHLSVPNFGPFECRHVGRLAHLHAATREPTDAVLLDLDLPDSRGLATLRRAREIVGDIPIVVQTHAADPSLPRRAMAGGAQDYVAKGAVGGRALARALRFAVARARASAGSADGTLRCPHTGLVTRALLGDRLTAELGRAARDGSPLGAALIRIEALPPAALRTLGGSLAEALLPWETGAHLGDFAFVLLLPAESDVAARAEELVSVVRAAGGVPVEVRLARLEPGQPRARLSELLGEEV